VQNAAWLAPTPLPEILGEKLLEKKIAVSLGVVVATKNTPAFPSAQRTIGLSSARRFVSVPHGLNQQTSRCNFGGRWIGYFGAWIVPFIPHVVSSETAVPVCF
jgi:hypothetical protein